jgi:DNA-binding transcriptional LysR family regulator
MDWDKLKLFYITAKVGNISKAARELNVTQSALSRRISSLEYDLGTKLLNRHLRGVTLTPQGKVIYPELEKAFMRLESLDQLISSMENKLKGELKVASNLGFIDTWLNYYLPQFLKDYPEIRLSILAKEQLLDLIDKDIDIVITSFFPDSPLVEKIPLMTWHRKLYASPGYIEKHGMPKSVEDLDRHQLISFGESKSFPQEDRDWHLKIGKSPGERREPYLAINSMRAMVNAAQHDLGIISFSQESLLLKDTNLLPILPDIQGPKIDIYVVYLKQRHNLERLRVFLEFLKKVSAEFRPIIA